MMDADPITMPSIVSKKRVLLAQKLSMASSSVSPNARLVRALRIVRLNDSGVGGATVAIEVRCNPALRDSVSQQWGPYSQPPTPTAMPVLGLVDKE